MTAPRPADEAARLAALRDYKILDTPHEAPFDELARLAAYVCKTSCGLVTLVDAERQWFKAHVGIDLRETSRDISMCAHTITGRDALVVPDTLADPRFAENPLVTEEPRIRFYAAMPLIVGDGRAIGALAVLDYEPRTLDDGQLAALRALARQVVAQLELRRFLVEEQRLQYEGHTRFQLLARATNDAVYDWNLATNEIWWNEGLRTQLGLRPDALPTLEAWSARIHPDDLDRVEHSLYGVIDGGGQFWSNEYRFRIGNDTYRDIFDRGYVIRDEHGKATRMVGAMLDISERRRLEDQLRQAQKMEAIGQLSGGIAHDFNNLLTVIQVNAALLVRGHVEAKVREHANDIIEATERAASLTRQLLMVSRKQLMQQTVVDVNDVVRNMTRMLQRVLGEHITLTSQCSTQLPLVEADINMLEQVLLNLAVNARDAMPNGGELIIATGERRLRAAEPQQGFDVAAGSYVFVSVTDSGVGIAPEQLPHVFEPFFTTKDVGKGSGLGLATAYGIVRQHRGWIEVASQVGRGTTFCFYLPVTSATQPTAVKRPATSDELPGGTETILLVEDEDSLRNIVQGLLERMGYTVLAASSGVAALEVWRTQRPRIHLLLTDLVMPGGITGRDLAAKLVADEPSLRVLYTSGYIAAQGQTGEPLVEGVNFLQKPYQPDQLAKIVRDCLDRAVAGGD